MLWLIMAYLKAYKPSHVSPSGFTIMNIFFGQKAPLYMITTSEEKENKDITLQNNVQAHTFFSSKNEQTSAQKDRSHF